MLITLAISGYRSLRDLVVPLDRLTLMTGPNGSGKSNLYRALRLLGEVAQGRVIAALAQEGGLNSTLWAGPETPSAAVQRGEHPLQGTQRRQRVALKLGFASEDYGYAIDLGLPTEGRSAFARDPLIKTEAVWIGEQLNPRTTLAERRGPAVTLRDPETGAMGEAQVVHTKLADYDSMMTHAAHPKAAFELLNLRETMRAWRFYDALRSDQQAPARQAQIGTRTPVLAGDGANLAAALQTIVEVGDGDALAESIDDAFPGTQISITNRDGWFECAIHQKGLLRALSTAEISDGTLRYLMLTAALLSPRPPRLLVLNEPETSLMPALARLILRAAASTQVVVVSHAAPLIEALMAEPDVRTLTLEKRWGETQVIDADRPRWTWLKR